MASTYRGNAGDIKCVRSARRRAHTIRHASSTVDSVSLAVIPPARHLAALDPHAPSRVQHRHTPRKKKTNIATMACVASNVRVVARVPRVAGARGRGSVSAVRTRTFGFSLVAPPSRAATVTVRAKEEVQKREMADADASIEPCLVGWSDVDENGVEVYCCEQPGGAMQCKTIEANPEHEECELEVQDDGSLDISCDENDPK